VLHESCPQQSLCSFVVTVSSVVESFAAETFIAACTCYILVHVILHISF